MPLFQYMLSRKPFSIMTIFWGKMSLIAYYASDFPLTTEFKKAIVNIK